MRSHVAAEDTLKHKFVIPIVGNANGANGTVFKSDVTILNQNLDSNNRALPRDIKVEFYPRNGSAGPPTYRTLTLYTSQWDNFLQDFFPTPITGLGAIVVTAVDSARNELPTGYLDAIARIYTRQPATANCLNPNGEVSQALVSTVYEDLDATSPDPQFQEYGTIIGAKHDANFRTNVGIVNHSESAQTFIVEILAHNDVPGHTYELTVPAKGMVHELLQGSNYGNLDLYVFPKGSGFYFSAYAATTDNRTGDGWTFRATY